MWALVADPGRIGEWTFLHLVGYMGTELPVVGNAFFAKQAKRAADESAARFEFVEWVAGRQYRCAMSPTRWAGEREVEVRLHSELEDDGAHSRVQLIHRAEVPTWLASSYRMAAERQIRKVLAKLARRLTQ